MSVGELGGIYSAIKAEGMSTFDTYASQDPGASGVKLEFGLNMEQAFQGLSGATDVGDALVKSAPAAVEAVKKERAYKESVRTRLGLANQAAAQAAAPANHTMLYVGLGVGLLVVVIIIVVVVLYVKGVIKFFDAGRARDGAQGSYPGMAPISNAYAGQVWIAEGPSEGGSLTSPLNVPWGVWPSWQTMGTNFGADSSGGGYPPSQTRAVTGMSTQLPLSHEVALPASEAIATGLQGPRGQSYVTPFVGVENPRLNRWYRYKTQG